ncbi:MAG: hypothetical protein HY868_26730 [Chloroflexi bacterium]|nr:hypothetical protein [Chloroflexota bacterium]
MSNSFRFNINDLLPRRILDAITEIRVNHPEVISEQAAARRKRARLTRDGKLVILACDHPQRGVTHSGNDPLIMGNRQEYLGRALRIITDPSLDGVMAPPDLIEDLFIVDYLVQRGGGPSFLDERVMLGCMQRGGIAGVVGEVNDRFSAYTPESIAAERLDGGKMMFRFIPDDEGTLLTIDYCARAVTELHRRGLFAFVEPLPQEKIDGNYKGNASVLLLVKLVNVSAALGESSQHTWLKIPYVERYDQVAGATTLPILMLGGESAGDIAPTLHNFEKGMCAGASVRGAMIGRNILFPGDSDPLAAALAVNAVVHQGATPEQALAQMAANAGKGMDALTRWIK